MVEDNGNQVQQITDVPELLRSILEMVQELASAVGAGELERGFEFRWGCQNHSTFSP